MTLRSLTGVLLVLLTGSAAVPAAAGAEASQPAPAVVRPAPVVVAVADAGVNPYHRAFLRPENTEHPCTWVPGFSDCSLPSLPLTVGTEDYAGAVDADGPLWARVVPGHWYWIPRTNIIGAVCDPTAGEAPPATPDITAYPELPQADTACIRDDGTGSGAASAVVAEAPHALLLIHDGDGSAARLRTAPVVPDVQVHRWAPVLPVPAAAAGTVGDRACPRAFRHPQTLYFVPAGDGAPLPAVAGCERAGLDLQIVGGAYPGYWKYNSGSAYDYASWHCRPVAPAGKTSAVEDHACGTHLAAATAAGAAAEALRLVRERDGAVSPGNPELVSRSVTRAGFVQAMQNGASYDPVPRYAVPAGSGCAFVMCYVGWVPLPVAAGRLVWGYGWLDGTVAPTVAACALGGSCSSRPVGASEYNQARRAVRAAEDAP